MADPEKAGRKQGRGRFQPGQSGNPKGKPPGARHRATQLLEKLMADDAEDVVRSVIIAAKMGDMTAAKIVVDRLIPLRKGRPVTFALPPIATVEDCGTALDAVLRAVAEGDLTPDEAGPVAAIIEARRKAHELVEIERRLAALEQEATR